MKFCGSSIYDTSEKKEKRKKEAVWMLDNSALHWQGGRVRKGEGEKGKDANRQCTPNRGRGLGGGGLGLRLVCGYIRGQ